MLAAAISSTLDAQVFYEVLAPDGSRDWLLGTVHSDDPRVADLPPVVEQAVAQADVVALELLPDREMLERLDEAMTLPAGQRLAEMLEPDLYRRVARALQRDGLDRRRIDRLRPWAAAMTLAQPRAEPGAFMDLVVARRAAETGSELVALETLEAQTGFFAALGDSGHAELLRAALAGRARREADFEALLSAYLDGDLDRLHRLALDRRSCAPQPLLARFTAHGLDARNRRMVRVAVPILRADAALIAVGALHLAGDHGIVSLLRKRGFDVRPIY